MKIVGMMPARNEGWILGMTARAALCWCDALVILVHASTDDTAKVAITVAQENNPRVTVMGDDKPVWEEMRHRQAMLDCARAVEATHLALVDADEVLTGNLFSQVRAFFTNTPSDYVLQLPMLCMRNSLVEAHDSGVWSRGLISFGFKDDPGWFWSSAIRNGYDYHHRHPMGKNFLGYCPIPRTEGGVMHLQFVNDRRLRAKQALYKMQETVRWPGRTNAVELNRKYDQAVYGSARREDTQLFRTVPASYWDPYSDLMKYVDWEAEPWQEEECKRLLDLHGEKTFSGLDLFGVLDGFKASEGAARSFTPIQA